MILTQSNVLATKHVLAKATKTSKAVNIHRAGVRIFISIRQNPKLQKDKMN